MKDKNQKSSLIIRDSRKEKRELEHRESVNEIKIERMEAEENKISLEEEINFLEDNHEKLGSRKIDKFQTSYIEEHEEQEAINFIEKELGFERPRAVGYKMVIKIYERPEEYKVFKDKDGKVKALYLPENARANDKYMSAVGLVLHQGQYCYKGTRWEEGIFMKSMRWLLEPFIGPSYKKPLCKVGDWIIFARNAGLQGFYRGMPVVYLNDDDICGVVNDPRHFSRTQ
jgi:hypothetical protein